MNAGGQHEFSCPQCGAVNTIESYAIRNMYQEQYASCVKCGKELEIVPADGIGDQINLIVTLASDTAVR